MAGDDTLVPAGEALVDLLRLNGIDKVFSVPGESFLPVLEALRQAPDIELVICRQEGGVTMMAEAWGKLTGRPGVCFVTRGPGGANAIAGLHVASQDSTPLILFVGQVPRDYLDREAWQEIDPRALYGSMTKWAAQIHDPARLPEYVSRAFHTALAGRPGPVVLGLPEDMLSVKVQVPALHRAPAVQSRPAPQAIASLQEMLASAERPLAIVGGVGWTAQAREQMHAFAARNSLPVATAFRRQDRFDNTSPEYAGEAGLGINPRLADRIRQSDLLLAIGTRLGDVVTGHYQLVSVPRPHQRLVHVHADLQELGRVYQPDLAIGAGVVQCCAAL
ncbi:MAG: thiamine pyrophosphate-binding protein, partial [Isosphaeraceae bacterium]